VDPNKTEKEKKSLSPEAYEDSRQPLLDHLDELLKRGRRIVIWIFLGAIVGYLFSSDMVKLIERPILLYEGEGAPKLIFTQPFEKFWVYLRISFISGMLFVIPFVGWEIAQFVGPGLKKIEKKRIIFLTVSTYVAMLLGVVLGYLYVLPAVIEVVVKFGSDFVFAQWTLAAYVNTAIGILLLCAVFMELPVVMVHLSAWGWVDPHQWSKGRRLAIVANAVISGILSPPDPLSMLTMMVPVQLLYEGGIFLAYMARWIGHGKHKS